MHDAVDAFMFVTPAGRLLLEKSACIEQNWRRRDETCAKDPSSDHRLPGEAAAEWYGGGVSEAALRAVFTYKVVLGSRTTRKLFHL